MECFVEAPFLIRFERVWGGFWETENLDFCILFDVFRCKIWSAIRRGKKSRNKASKTAEVIILEPVRRNVHGPGERLREGVMSSEPGI